MGPRPNTQATSSTTRTYLLAKAQIVTVTECLQLLEQHRSRLSAEDITKIKSDVEKNKLSSLMTFVGGIVSNSLGHRFGSTLRTFQGQTDIYLIRDAQTVRVDSNLDVEATEAVRPTQILDRAQQSTHPAFSEQHLQQLAPFHGYLQNAGDDWSCYPH